MSHSRWPHPLIYLGPSDPARRIAALNAGSGEASARPKRPSPNREIQALAQIPAPNVEALATAAMIGAPTATPATRRA